MGEREEIIEENLLSIDNNEDDISTNRISAKNLNTMW